MWTGDDGCSGCPNTAVNTIWLIGFVLLILIYIFILIFFNIRKQKDSKNSTITRILTNYMQTVSASISFNLTYPKLLNDSVSPAKSVGQSTTTILSFDCFIAFLNINIFGSSPYIFKSFLTCLTPIPIIIFFMALFGIYKLIWRKKTLLKRNLVVSTITILYFLHPSIT